MDKQCKKMVSLKKAHFKSFVALDASEKKKYNDKHKNIVSGIIPEYFIMIFFYICTQLNTNLFLIS